MIEWLTTHQDDACYGNVAPEEELVTETPTIGSYEDLRSSMKFQRITKKLLVELLWRKYLGTITKKSLKQKSRDALIKEAGLTVWVK